jgi:predicted anti-sigma-YlaC factor YlaD
MNTNHLSPFEQEEYVINERTPQMDRHLTECAACRASVERLQQGIATYRSAALQWSAESLAARPQQILSLPRRSLVSLRWAFAAVIPVLLLVLAFLPLRFSRTKVAQPVAQLSDDALLDQVDEQLSVAVPSSMESLTHLVSTDSTRQSSAGTVGSKPIVQTN